MTEKTRFQTPHGYEHLPMVDRLALESSDYLGCERCRLIKPAICDYHRGFTNGFYEGIRKMTPENSVDD